MLNVHHILGNTFAFETQLALLPFYKLRDREIVLLDSGFASTDRQELIDTLRAYDFCVRGILCSHAHMDHAGNIGHLCSVYGCRVAAHRYEAAIAAPDSELRQFGIHASSRHGLEECFVTTDVIQPGQTTLDFCGATFGVLHLSGHSDGHLGYVTPDNVAYLGDVIMGFSQYLYMTAALCCGPRDSLIVALGSSRRGTSRVSAFRLAEKYRKAAPAARPREPFTRRGSSAVPMQSRLSGTTREAR